MAHRNYIVVTLDIAKEVLAAHDERHTPEFLIELIDALEDWIDALLNEAEGEE